MCWIDFGMSVDGDGDNRMINGQDTALRNLRDIPVNNKLKRKLRECQIKQLLGRKNFDIYTFRNPVLFIGHLCENHVLIVDKPWIEVVKTFDTKPVHRHIFGT